jgi:hypothetical protein
MKLFGHSYRMKPFKLPTCTLRITNKGSGGWASLKKDADEREIHEKLVDGKVGDKEEREAFQAYVILFSVKENITRLPFMDFRLQEFLCTQG